MAEKSYYFTKWEEQGIAFSRMQLAGIKQALYEYAQPTHEPAAVALAREGRGVLTFLGGISTAVTAAVEPWGALIPGAVTAGVMVDGLIGRWSRATADKYQKNPDIRIPRGSFYAGARSEYMQYDGMEGVPSHKQPIADPYKAVTFMLRHFRNGRERTFFDICWTNLEALGAHQEALTQDRSFIEGMDAETRELNTSLARTPYEQRHAVINSLHTLSGDFITALVLETQTQASEYSAAIDSPPEAHAMVADLQHTTSLWDVTEPPTYSEIAPTWKTLSAIHAHLNWVPSPPAPWETNAP